MLNENTNNKSKEEKKVYDLTNEEEIKIINIKQLLRLQGNIEKAIDKKILSSKLENFKDEKYITLEIKDYMAGCRKKHLKLIINNDNTVEGYNEDIDRLVIGKITKDNDIFLLDFNTAVPRLKCYEGTIDFNKKKVNGYASCKECLNSFIENMSLLDNSVSNLENFHDDNLNYKELKYHIRKLEKDILERVRYTRSERKLLLMIKEMV